MGWAARVTTGIISARGRDIHSGPFDDFLQIDAPINRGNSGGPTFNLDGQVIGINTAIYSPNGGSVGIGFAVPSNVAKTVVAQLEEHGKVSRGWLGVQIQEVTPAIAASLGLQAEHGALVAVVTPNSPGAKAGLKQGDVDPVVQRQRSGAAARPAAHGRRQPPRLEREDEGLAQRPDGRVAGDARRGPKTRGSPPPAASGEAAGGGAGPRRWACISPR